jgi:hypothetical protein
VHRAKQPYDTVNNYLLPPTTSGEGGFWTTFDWPSALAMGAEANGLEFSGEFGFAETWMYWPTTHMVQPKENALQCEDCHGDNGLHGLGGARLSRRSHRVGRTRCRKIICTFALERCDLCNALLRYFLVLALLLILALAAVMLGSGQATAQSEPETAAPLSPLHPVFVLLDAAGATCWKAAQPVSTMQTCGACHDTDFIASHSFHCRPGPEPA